MGDFAIFDKNGNLKVTGNTGATGATGPQGPVIIGVDGDDGYDGVPLPGSQGSPGPAGSNGAQGAAGPPGPPGDSNDDINDMDPPWPQLPSNVVNAANNNIAIGSSIIFPSQATAYINPNLIKPGVGGGYMPTPISRKNFWGYKDDTTATIFHSGIDCAPLLSSAGGTVSAVVNTAQSVMRFTTISGDNNFSGVQFQTVGMAGMFQHLPEFIIKFFTGSAIDHTQIWIGFFDNTSQSVNPGTNNLGVNTGKHCAIRYAPNSQGAANDTTWVFSNADGTTQHTSVGPAIATSTQYIFRISFSDSTSPAYQINDLTTGTAMNINTNAADATPMTFGMYITNDGAGTTRFLDFVSLYGSYN